MIEEYSDVIRRRIAFSGNLNDLKTYFVYPKLAIVGENGVIQVMDVEFDAGKDLHYELGEKITDSLLQEHLLWIVLSSNQLMVIDLLQGMQIQIEVINYANYTIRELRNYLSRMHFISESEECLVSPYSVKDLTDKMEARVMKIQMTVEKAKVRRAALLSRNSSTAVGGLDMYVDNGKMVVKCPVTGFRETIVSPTSLVLKNILAWGDFVVLADHCSMWVLNLDNSSVPLELKTDGVVYHPAGTHHNEFYYLFLNGNEAKIHCIQKDACPSNKDGEVKDGSNSTIKKSHSQEMLKSQVRSLIEIITTSDTDHKEMVKQMKLLFEQIEDLAFLVDAGSQLCQSNNFYKPLLYLIQPKIMELEDDNLIRELCDVIFKLDIIEYIQFTGNSHYKDLNIFNENFKQLCITFITNSDFDLACLCWLKYSEIKACVDADEILAILNAIPRNAKMGALVIWLKNFVPSLLDENPFHIDLLVRWTTERIFNLEHSSYWPKIGLKFIDEIVAVLVASSKTIVIRPISMDDLDVLKDRIIYVMELKEKYKINMLLAELSTQNPSEIALIMLRRCYTEDLESFLQDYLPTFATRHNFDLDNILRSYVESEAASGGGSIDGSRLRILLNSFRVPSNKLNCLLCVLRFLDVPWDASINELAVTAAAVATNDFTSNDTDRNLAKEIGEQINYANLKVVLKKYNYPLTHTDYTLVLHKIINTPVVDIEDLLTVMNITNVYKTYGSLLYIDRRLRDCSTKEALDYFKNLSERESRILLKSVMAKYEHIVSSTLSNKIIEKCYIDFFKGAQMLDETEISTIESMYHLKNSYDTNLCMNEMYCEKLQTEESADLQTTGAINSQHGKNLTGLARTQHWRNSALFDLLQRTSTCGQVRKFIEKLLATSSFTDNPPCDKIATMLSSHIHGDGINTAAFLTESSRVLVQLISNCTEEHLFYLTTILSILNALINTSIVMENLSAACKFHYVYMPVSSFDSEKELLELYAQNVDQEGFECDYVSNVCTRTDFVPFRIFAIVTGTYIETSLGDIFLHAKEMTVKRLISKIALSQETDELFVTSLLLILNTGDVQDLDSWLLDILRGPNETMPSNVVAYLASPIVQRVFALNKALLPGSAASYPPQYVLKTKYNITLADIALPDITEETWDVKIVLFYVLRQEPHTSLERLIDLCRTLNVTIDDGLSLKLIAILTTWDLKYKKVRDDLGLPLIHTENDEKALLSECLVIWESIKNKDFLRDILNDFWKNGEVSIHGRLVSINPYFYEVYLCIFQIICRTTTEIKKSKEYFMLNFLKNYKRKSEPQQYEFESFSVKGMFPEIGHYRLPFHLFMRDDMWHNLKSEITLETYQQWLPAVALLALDKDLQVAKDMICSNALKQTMKTRKVDSNTHTDNDTEPWRLTTREEPLLNAASRCVGHIANMEWAGACLFYVLQGCGRGADQVAAAQLCYQFAQHWEALQPGNRAVRKMERLHSTLSTRHALHKIEWATEELLELLAEPSQLINAMYMHPTFVDKMTRYDVNNAANEIADKNGIIISSIRIQILENLLEKKIDIRNKNNFGLDNRELMTAKYILKATCPKMGAIYLSRIAFDEDTDFNKHKKLRALQCLMSIVEPDTALKVTNKNRDLLWSSLLDLFYIIHLEHIEMPWAVSTFTLDKSSALEQIVSATGSNTNGLKLAAELARTYGNKKFIVKVIHVLFRATLYEDMIPLLLKVMTPYDEIIRKAWRAVLLLPFQSADYPITERQKLNCLRTINLLPLCPVIRDEDLKEIWKNCMRCKCFGIACLVLPYMTYEARQSLTELRKIDRRNLIISLKNLQTETYLVSGAMFVIENMISKGSYR